MLEDGLERWNRARRLAKGRKLEKILKESIVRWDERRFLGLQVREKEGSAIWHATVALTSREFDDSVEHAEKSLEVNRDHELESLFLSILGWVSWKRLFNEATKKPEIDFLVSESAFQRARRLQPDFEFPNHFLAVLYSTYGPYNPFVLSPKETFLFARRQFLGEHRNRKDARSLYDYALAYAKNHNDVQAAWILQHGIEHFPGSKDIVFLYAQVLDVLGRDAEAELYFSLAAKLGVPPGIATGCKNRLLDAIGIPTDER